MREWGSWDWAAGITLWTTVVLSSVDAALKLMPELAGRIGAAIGHVPLFFRAVWAFAPLVLLTVATSIFVGRATGLVGGNQQEEHKPVATILSTPSNPPNVERQSKIPEDYRLVFPVNDTFHLVNRVRNIIAQNQSLTWVTTAPSSLEHFRRDWEYLLGAACQGVASSAATFCAAYTAPNPELVLDTGIPEPKYSGIVIHYTASATQIALYMSIAVPCVTFRRSENIPPAIEKLRIHPDRPFVWFEIGPGSPWDASHKCTFN